MPEINPKEIGMRVYTLRVSRELSQFKLAQLIGTTQGTIQRCESGIGMIKLNIIAKLARAFGVTLDYLVWGGGVDVE